MYFLKARLKAASEWYPTYSDRTSSWRLRALQACSSRFGSLTSLLSVICRMAYPEWVIPNTSRTRVNSGYCLEWRSIRATLGLSG